MIASCFCLALGTFAYNISSNFVPYKVYLYSQNNIAKRIYVCVCVCVCVCVYTHIVKYCYPI